jgi:hypothetical protein
VKLLKDRTVLNSLPYYDFLSVTAETRELVRHRRACCRPLTMF